MCHLEHRTREVRDGETLTLRARFPCRCEDFDVRVVGRMVPRYMMISFECVNSDVLFIPMMLGVAVKRVCQSRKTCVLGDQTYL